MTEKKSLLVSYLLWFFGGFFGLHHFYLGRDRHCFITWLSFGGYFGMGWFRDLWRLPEYVKDANEDPLYMRELSEEIKRRPKPNASWVRYSGAIIVADIFGYLLVGAMPVGIIPDNLQFIVPVSCAIFVPLVCALGIHTVYNVGRFKCSLKYPLIGAYVTAPLYLWSNNIVFWTSLISLLVSDHYGKKWRRKPKKLRSHFKRIQILAVCGLLYSSLWVSWFYFNCSFTDKNEEEVRCRDALSNFLKTLPWKDFLQVMSDLKVYVRHNGWRGLWREIVSSFDPQGEENALKVLNLTSDASQETITNTYRKLARLWHPDRHKDSAEKVDAQEKFIAIQQAYELLSNIKAKRRERNEKARDLVPEPQKVDESKQDL